MSNAWEDRRVVPRLSVSQISTLNSTFADDIRTYRAAGFDGIGVWELKLPAVGSDAERLELLAESGLESAGAVTLNAAKSLAVTARLSVTRKLPNQRRK